MELQRFAKRKSGVLKTAARQLRSGLNLLDKHSEYPACCVANVAFVSLLPYVRCFQFSVCLFTLRSFLCCVIRSSAA